MDHAGVLLGRTHVAGVLEGDPRVAGFKQHGQHLAPQVSGFHHARGLDQTLSGLLLVGDIGFLKICAELVVQVGHVGRREQRPLAFFHHAAHEQVGHPVGGVHVVRAASVVAGVLAQLQKLFDIEVPGFQVGAHRALALAALVDCHRRVVDHLEERHHALRLAVGALDVGTQRAHAGPVVAQATGVLGQQGVFLDRLVDAVQIVGHGGQIARRELRAQRAAVEQRGCARHEVKTRKHLVELDGARFAVDLAQCQAHRNAHEKRLRQLDAGLAHVQEVAVVQGLQPEVVKVQIARGIQRSTEANQVKLQEALVEQLGVHGALHIAGEVVAVGLCHVGGRHFALQHFARNGVEQQARGYIGVVGLFFNQRACGQD